MELDPKGLLRQLSDVGLGVAKSFESERAVGFVKALISSMDKTVKAIDKYLKKGKDALEKGKQIVESKGKGLVDLAKSKFSEVKDTGLLATAKKTAQDTTGKFKDMFASDIEKANGPPNGEPLTNMQHLGKLFGGAKDKAEKLADDTKASESFNSLIAAMSGLKTSIVTLTKTNKETTKPTDAQASTGATKLNRFVEAFNKQKQRMFARQKEVDDEKSGANTKDKSKAKGPLGMIISAIGALGGVFTSVIGKGIGKLLMFLPKIMLRGMGGLLTRLIPSLAGLIAPGAASAIGSVAGGVATTVGGAALSGLGTAAAAVGTAILSPIGLGIIAVGVTAYAGYKLYKYLNRNNTGLGLSGKLTKLRLLSYGYNDVVKEHYNKVLDMDMLVKDYVSVKDGRAIYKKFDAKFKKAILDIFSIARTDKVKYELLNTWFIKRYVPAHAGFMNAYYNAGGKDYIDDLDKLNPEQTFKFITNYRLQPEVFDQKSIPVFEAPDCTVSKADVDALIVEITKEAKEGVDKAKDKKARVAAKKPTRIEENKAYDKAGVDASDKKFTKPKELEEAAKDIPGAVDSSDKKFLTPKAPTANTEGLADPSDRKFSKAKEPLTGNEEGEKPPPASTEKAALEDKPLQSSIDKVSKAPGPLKTGGADLVGIKSKVPTEKIQNLDPNVLNLLSGMTKEYSELTGKSITVNEAFRTREDQVALKASKGAGAAAPGTSLHEFGIAVDISSADADTLDKMGLMRKYGFTRPIGGEAWHIEPAGVSLNPGGSKSDPQERMKNILSSPGRGGGGLGANRGLPSAMKYKRDMALQKTLFNSGASIESPVEVADLKKDQGIATGPIVDSKPVATKVKTTGADPSQTLHPKQEGLDIPKAPKPAEGPQLTNALYRPPMQDKKVYSDYSEAEKPPKEGASKSTDDANANLGPKEAILKASKVVGVDYNKLLTFAKLESSLKSGVQSAASTATGLFQIVGDTWRDLLKRFGPKYNIPADAQPTNAYYNSVLGACYAKENMAKMEKYKDCGISQDILTYLAHHFGPEGGERIVKAFMKNPDSPMQMHVSEKAYTSNIQVLSNKTVRQYIDSLVAKFNKAGASEYGGKDTPAVVKTTANAKESYRQKSPTFNDAPESGSAKLAVENMAAKTKPMTLQVLRDQTSITSDGVDVSTPVRNETLPVEQMIRKSIFGMPTESVMPSYPVTFSKQATQKPSPGFSTGNAKASNPFSSINSTISSAANQINKPINDISGAMGNAASQVNGVVGGINGVFNNISKGITDTTSILNKGMNPASTMNTTQQAVPQQPSAAMSLDKTESLLTNMGDTLTQIKVILQSISDKGAMAPAQANTPETRAQAKETPQSKEPIRAPNYNAPSTEGVSMSRRSVLT